MIRILIVEDERPISDLIKMSLTGMGYSCKCVYDGLAAADILSQMQFDLILLDVMLPGASGFELMDYIRPMEIPVIFLTAKSDVRDRVKGLHLGAEDYIVKPFEIIELQARVETVLRRYHKLDRILRVGGLEIDTYSRTVHRDGQEIALTKKEFDLIHKEIDRRKGKDASVTTEDEKKTLEKITGFAYNDLWKRDNAVKL